MTDWKATLVDRHHAALVVVDLQNDFLPGGALPVARGDRIVEPIAALVDSPHFRLVVATQDWHPRHHCSFASFHPGHKPFDTVALNGRDQVLWPDHCVAGSAGAALCAGVPWDRARAIIRKGTELDVDSYSGFRNDWNAHGERVATGLGGFLKECGVSKVYVCGLARDFCVLATAIDAAELGFTTTVIWDLTRAVDAATNDRTRETLEASGVALAEWAELE